MLLWKSLAVLLAMLPLILLLFHTSGELLNISKSGKAQFKETTIFFKNHGNNKLV